MLSSYPQFSKIYGLTAITLVLQAGGRSDPKTHGYIDNRVAHIDDLFDRLTVEGQLILLFLLIYRELLYKKKLIRAYFFSVQWLLSLDTNVEFPAT